MRAFLRISGLCILVTLALSGRAYAQNDRVIVLESAPIVLVPGANRETRTDPDRRTHQAERFQRWETLGLNLHRGPSACRRSFDW